MDLCRLCRNQTGRYIGRGFCKKKKKRELNDFCGGGRTVRSFHGMAHVSTLLSSASRLLPFFSIILGLGFFFLETNSSHYISRGECFAAFKGLSLSFKFDEVSFTSSLSWILREGTRVTPISSISRSVRSQSFFLSAVSF